MVHLFWAICFNLQAVDKKMGETYAEIKLKTNNREIEHKLLVDTGSTYSWIRAGILRKLKIKPVRTEKLATIEGRIIRRKFGFVEMECLGRTGPSGVIFAQKGDSEVLGLVALETLALEVDPRNRKLKKASAMKALRAK